MPFKTLKWKEKVLKKICMPLKWWLESWKQWNLPFWRSASIFHKVRSCLPLVLEAADFSKNFQAFLENYSKENNIFRMCIYFVSNISLTVSLCYQWFLEKYVFRKLGHSVEQLKAWGHNHSMSIFRPFFIFSRSDGQFVAIFPSNFPMTPRSAQFTLGH